MKLLVSNETELKGSVQVDGNAVYFDDISNRIIQLTNQNLILVAKDPSGWDSLYFDPRDGRFWELSYPNSERHGGGAPLLKVLDSCDERHKHKFK